MSVTKTSSKTGGSGQDDRGDRLTVLHEQIAAGVAALVETDRWQQMLQAAAKFHTYSLGNVLLIALQAPQASRVAGFRTWQGLGRQVRKGERGIAILAPSSSRPTTSAAGTDSTGEQPQAQCGGVVAPAGAGRQLRGFRVVHVFALDQTEGDPLPDVAPVLLTGQAPAGLWDDLAGQVSGHGYTLERGDCSGANGWTDPARRVVRVRADVDDAQAVKTHFGP